MDDDYAKTQLTHHNKQPAEITHIQTVNSIRTGKKQPNFPASSQQPLN